MHSVTDKQKDRQTDDSGSLYIGLKLYETRYMFKRTQSLSNAYL